MYKILIFSTVILTSCLNAKKDERTLVLNNSSVNRIINKDSLSLRINALSKFNLTTFSIGNKQITGDISQTSLYINNNELIYNSNGEILENLFHNFYSPTTHSSTERDGYPLFEDKDYLHKVGIKSSGLENVIQNSEGVFWCIFFVNYNYDREFETFVKPIRYLVAFDDNLKILKEFTLSFFYETETKSFIKLFYLDENNILYSMYYKNKEYEDGQIKESFSKLITHEILKNGEIVKK